MQFQIGDKFTHLAPSLLNAEWNELAKPQPAVLIWNHPRGRFGVVEFVCKDGKRFREAFSAEELAGRKYITKKYTGPGTRKNTPTHYKPQEFKPSGAATRGGAAAANGKCAKGTCSGSGEVTVLTGEALVAAAGHGTRRRREAWWSNSF